MKNKSLIMFVALSLCFTMLFSTQTVAVSAGSTPFISNENEQDLQDDVLPSLNEEDMDSQDDAPSDLNEEDSNKNLALGKSVTYSGVEGGKVGEDWRYPQFVGEMAVDGDAGTRWSADRVDDQWLIIDLGEVQEVNEIVIDFHATSPDYEVFVSNDGNQYESVYKVTNGPEGTNNGITEISFDRKIVRFIKYQQYKQWLHPDGIRYFSTSIRELEVYNKDTVEEEPVPPKELLENRLNEAKDYQAKHYTEESYAVLQASIQNAEYVLGHANADETEIKDAIQSLVDAINQLKIKSTGPNKNLALGKSVTYSGVEGGKTGANWKYPQFVGEMAVDGDAGTRWSADKFDNQWLIVDLGEVQPVSEIDINFHATSPDYEVFISKDGNQYESVFKVTDGPEGVKEIKEITFDHQLARYIKYQQNKQFKHTNDKYYSSSIYELEAYKNIRYTAVHVLAAAEEQQLKLSEDGKRLVLPTVNDDYKISLFGSDNKEVIALDGTVHQPLVAMNVNVLYKVENINDPDDFATSEADISIAVPGQYKQESGDNPVPPVLPGLREWKGDKGNFTLTENSKIVVADGSLKETAQTIQKYFKNMLNKDMPISDGTAQPGDIVLALDGKQTILGEEGYTLSIDDTIIIAAPTVKGVLYGGISITQILYQDKNHMNVPKGLARDYPKYEVRAGMIDVGRMYIPLEYVQEMTMYMAWFKLNEMQIHVNDYRSGSGYAAFRLESEKYPQITAKDGYYTKEEYKQYQIDMKKYGIDVITEIDTPYHSEAFRAIPGVKMLYKGGLDIRDNNTVNIVLDLLDEYLDGEDPVIQSKKFHVGTDEYDKAYSEEMRAYTDKLIKYVNGKGYETRIWGELGTRGYNGKTPVTNQATMNIWSPSRSDVKEMYAAGYDIINTDGGWLYIVPGSNANFPDRLNLTNLYNNFDVNNFYSPKYAGNGTAIMPIAHPQTKGAEFAVWNDMTSFGGGFSQFDVFDRMRSAVAIIAEKTWYGEKTEGQTAEQFMKRVEALYHTAGGANPGRYVRSDGDVIAKYTFDVLNGGYLEDSSPNRYDAQVVNGVLDKGTNSNGIALNGDGYISLPFDSVGFPYKVSFDINLSEIPENTELFTGKDGSLYANMNGTGKLGFKRGELGIAYEFLFDYELPVGEWVNIELAQELTYRTGSSDSNTSMTKLYVNGESIGVAESIKEPINNIRYSSSFVLPTEKIMNQAKGRIDNLLIARTTGEDRNNRRENLALHKPTSTSSVYPGSTWTGDKAVDGIDRDLSSRWSSKKATGLGSNEDSGLHGTKEQWISVDLGHPYALSEVYISWERAYAIVFKLQGSLDGIQYFDMKEITNFTGGKITISDIGERPVQYIRVYAMEPFNAGWGYSIYEIEAYAADKSKLMRTIAAAEKRLEETVQGDKPGQYPKSEREALEAAIALAKELIENKMATQEAVDEAVVALNHAIEAYNASEVPGKEKPDAPTAKDVTVTRPAVDAAVGQTLITINAALEFRIISASNVEKQAWTSGTGGAQKTSATPALVAGDKIEVRVKATDSTLASGIYTYIVAADDIGRAATIVMPPITSDTGSKPEGDSTLAPGQSGTFSLNKEITVAIPSGATDKMLHVVLKKIADPSALVGNQGDLLSSVIEVSSNLTEKLKKPAAVTLSFDSSKLASGTKASIFVYDGVKKEWIEIGGNVSGNTITAQVDRFGTFAVFAVTSNGDINEETFIDVTNHWAEASIQKAVALGFINGYPDGTFRPNAQITRAEFIVMLAKALKLQGNGKELTFTDQADIGQWARQAIAQAVEAGIINGYTDGAFRPNAKISRTEMVLMTVRALKLKVEAVGQTSFRDDLDIPQWGKASVVAAAKEGLVKGVGENRFAPNHTATRAESVTLLLKAIELNS